MNVLRDPKDTRHKHSPSNRKGPNMPQPHALAWITTATSPCTSGNLGFLVWLRLSRLPEHDSVLVEDSNPTPIFEVDPCRAHWLQLLGGISGSTDCQKE